MRELDYVFAGGPGRSGTSFVTRQMGTHPAIATYTATELKLYCEIDGFVTLYENLVTGYTPNRAMVSIKRFNAICKRLVAGGYAQQQLGNNFLNLTADFTDKITQNDMGRFMEEEEFFDAIKEFTRLIGNNCAEMKKGDTEVKYFLEKTPHNLLKADFISRIFPDAIYLHVVRDPRSIARSLLKMKWGPNETEGAVLWVKGYFQAWARARALILEKGLRLKELSIEDVALNPKSTSEETLGFLGLSPEKRVLFAKADIDALNAWVKDTDKDLLSQLKEELGETAIALGYDADTIGKREPLQ